jgi:hypothetical protein
MKLPIPPFNPDKSPFNIGASNNLKNCLPVADGWGPMPGLTEISSSLGAQCYGATWVTRDDGNVSIFAGTQAGLFLLDTTDYTWIDVSGPSAPYAVPTNDLWTFTLFGPQLIAHNITDNPQVIDINAGTDFADLAGSPPKAKYSWVAGDFLVFGHLSTEPKAVAWSGINDCEYWQFGQRFSDTQTFPSGGQVQGGIGSQTGAIVLQKDQIRYMNFAPQSGYTFTFSEANGKRGVMAPLSIAQVGQNQFYYLSEQGFFGGVEGTPIGAERVDRWFFDNCDGNTLVDVQALNDPFKKIVWWKFTVSTGASYMLGYNWQLDRWCWSDENVTVALGIAVPAITWDGLDTLYATIDDVSEPFDSRLFSGGRPVFAAFTTGNKLAYFTGANKAATAETALVEISAGTRTFVNAARVEVDSQEHTVEVGGADYHGDTVTYRAAASPSVRSGLVPLRCDARLHRFRVNMAAGAIWTTLSSISPEIPTMAGKQ